MQPAGPGCEHTGRRGEVQPRLQLLLLHTEIREVLVLHRQSMGLLLHRRVEEQNGQDPGCEHRSQTSGERDVPAVGRRRSRPTTRARGGGQTQYGAIRDPLIGTGSSRRRDLQTPSSGRAGAGRVGQVVTEGQL
jgi:hypothetical protein